MNNLHGSIPSCLSNLTSMVQQGGFSQDVQFITTYKAYEFKQETYVDHAMIEWNALSGEIPQKIGEMKKLLTLDLSTNNFSGQIPSSMSQMSLLNELDLSYNNLSWRIPSALNSNPFCDIPKITARKDRFHLCF
uniref:Non-specific serine/threonine protein kinase n=1 Tax=Lactuca sativa TaxID=4236 RepID=A0A9R1VCA6_LACSA|nr:hypothetical protein LSAT_V11C600315030 [Lactuca sativa]